MQWLLCWCISLLAIETPMAYVLGSFKFPVISSTSVLRTVADLSSKQEIYLSNGYHLSSSFTTHAFARILEGSHANSATYTKLSPSMLKDRPLLRVFEQFFFGVYDDVRKHCTTIVVSQLQLECMARYQAKVSHIHKPHYVQLGY